MVASRNSSLAASTRRNPTLVVKPSTAVSSSAATSARRAASRSRAVGDDLAQHRVVGRGDDLAALQRRVDPRRSAGPAHERGRAGLGQEAVEGVLGVDARLDGVALEPQVVLGERQLLARGDRGAAARRRSHRRSPAR